MAQIMYSTDLLDENLHLYISRDRNTMDFERAEAEEIAERIARRGGRARVLIGGTICAEYPDPEAPYIDID